MGSKTDDTPTVRFLTPKDIAQRLSISRASAYRLMQSMPRVRIGRLVRVSEHDFDAFIREKTIQPWRPERSEDSRPGRSKDRTPERSEIETWLPPITPRRKRSAAADTADAMTRIRAVVARATRR